MHPPTFRPRPACSFSPSSSPPSLQGPSASASGWSACSCGPLDSQPGSSSRSSFSTLVSHLLAELPISVCAAPSPSWHGTFEAKLEPLDGPSAGFHSLGIHLKQHEDPDPKRSAPTCWVTRLKPKDLPRPLSKAQIAEIESDKTKRRRWKPSCLLNACLTANKDALASNTGIDCCLFHLYLPTTVHFFWRQLRGTCMNCSDSTFPSTTSIGLSRRASCSLAAAHCNAPASQSSPAMLIPKAVARGFRKLSCSNRHLSENFPSSLTSCSGKNEAVAPRPQFEASIAVTSLSHSIAKFRQIKGHIPTKIWSSLRTDFHSLWTEW